MTGNVIISGGDVAATTPRRDEQMEIGILMTITKDQERHVCKEKEPRVKYDKLVIPKKTPCYFCGGLQLLLCIGK